MTPLDTLDPREAALFQAFDLDGDGVVRLSEVELVLEKAGLDLDDPRLVEIRRRLKRHRRGGMGPGAFRDAVRPGILLVERAVRGQLVVPDFTTFAERLEQIFEGARAQRGGQVADYIPQLGRVDPELLGMAVRTVDGQVWSAGDADVDFCVQSTCKPINYAIALEQHGDAKVHQHVGREPSGRGFNELTLDHEGKPHNPMINAGAIMACSLISPGQPMADRFDGVMNTWRRLAGGRKPGFSNAVYLSERETADRNFALGYMMRERGAFPADTDLVETLEFYFQCCSIETDCERMATVAATLAAGGVCPTTGERVFSADTVRRCLSLMQSCGMYDFSGEFAFTIGLPAKSGVAGAVMLVVPNVMGLCVWSPRLDRNGNSVRGIEVCKGLVEQFPFHPFDVLFGTSEKWDPRHRPDADEAETIEQLIWAASIGDVIAVQQQLACGCDPNDSDYDGRTPLHLAAAEGHLDVVELLLHRGASPSPVDRWGGTPADDARRHGHTSVSLALEKAAAASEIAPAGEDEPAPEVGAEPSP